MIKEIFHKYNSVILNNKIICPITTEENELSKEFAKKICESNNSYVQNNRAIQNFEKYEQDHYFSKLAEFGYKRFATENNIDLNLSDPDCNIYTVGHDGKNWKPDLTGTNADHHVKSHNRTTGMESVLFQVQNSKSNYTNSVKDLINIAFNEEKSYSKDNLFRNNNSNKKQYIAFMVAKKNIKNDVEIFFRGVLTWDFIVKNKNRIFQYTENENIKNQKLAIYSYKLITLAEENSFLL